MGYSLSIIGCGGHARVLLEIIDLLGLNISFLYDDNLGVDIPLNLIDKFVSPVNYEISEKAIIAIGDNSLRKKVSDRMNKKIWDIIIHPSSIISKDMVIGEGTVIMAGAIIQTGSRIGKHCIINTGACIDHDCEIGSFAHISPNVSIAGGVCIGEGTHIGIGACVIPGITIGKWVKIGAGAVVIRDIPDFSVAVGNPARIIKYNKNDE